MSSVLKAAMQLSEPEVSEKSSAIPRPMSLAGGVYESIFAQLMSLEIAPGARITVDNLVKELDVSQTPIREALGRLEGEGLVTRTHLVGYRAAPQITKAQFQELYELRLLLEPDAVAKAASIVTDAQFDELRALSEVMAQNEGNDEQLRYSNFARKDADFHDRILEIAGNELIRETLRVQHTHFHIFRLMFHWRVTAEALDEHDAILKALAERNPDAARRAMRTHIENSKIRLLPAFE